MHLICYCLELYWKKNTTQEKFIVHRDFFSIVQNKREKKCIFYNFESHLKTPPSGCNFPKILRFVIPFFQNSIPPHLTSFLTPEKLKWNLTLWCISLNCYCKCSVIFGLPQCSAWGRSPQKFRDKFCVSLSCKSHASLFSNHQWFFYNQMKKVPFFSKFFYRIGNFKA